MKIFTHAVRYRGRLLTIINRPASRLIGLIAHGRYRALRTAARLTAVVVALTTVFTLAWACLPAPRSAWAATSPVLTAPAAIVRAAPSSEARVLRIVHEGTSMRVLAEQGAFCWVECEGVTGFVAASALTAHKNGMGTIDYGDSGLMVTWLQNALRQWDCFKGEPSGFYGVGTRAAVEAFQRKQDIAVSGRADIVTQEALIALTESRASVSTVSYDLGGVQEVSGASYKYLLQGSQGEAVERLQQALYDAGFLKSAPSGFFGEETEAAVIAFQQSAGLWDDGVAGEETQETLFNHGAESAVTHITPRVAGALKPIAKSSKQVNGVWALDWDDGDVERVFPRHTYAAVIDVRTGLRYYVRRFQGTNHADVELVTHEDYYTFLETFGGEWSWDARPIYLELDGELYAAAINGMPHGDVTLTTNGVDGHFCIHFIGSTTHESGNKNRTMQDAIQEAIKAAKSN